MTDEEKYRPLMSINEVGLIKTLEKCRGGIGFDIGANAGGETERMLEFLKSVHCFEPVPNMMQKLVHRFGANQKVVLNSSGMSSVPGTVRDQNVHRAWMLLPQGSVDISVEYKSSPPFDVEMTTIDQYVIDAGVIPAFIKIDVDGYELRVLKGATHFLFYHKPPMKFELSHLPGVLGDSTDEMCHLIYELGYQAVSIDGKYYCPSAEEMIRLFPQHTSYDILLLPKGFTL